MHCTVLTLTSNTTGNALAHLDDCNELQHLLCPYRIAEPAYEIVVYGLDPPPEYLLFIPFSYPMHSEAYEYSSLLCFLFLALLDLPAGCGWLG